MRKINKSGIDLIKEFEGLSLIPYLDSVGVPTIGYGNTYYENRSPVNMTDKAISKKRAEELLLNVVINFAKGVTGLLHNNINDNQFAALVSFAYNLGLGNLKKSTLLKKVNANTNDPTIAAEFMRWNKAGGMILNGLTRRRKMEAELYFKK